MLKKTVLALLFFAGGMLNAAAAPKPNVIIILNDDQGYQDLGCYGSPDIKTPHVDQLAREGMRFTDFYVASPVCSASRAAFLTGCYPYRVGVTGVFFPNRGHKGLPPEHTTMAEMLKSAGYATAAVGKWHLGDELEFLPTNQGFDSYYGIPYSNDMYPAKNMKYSKDCLFRDEQSFQTLDDAFTGKLNNGNPRSLKDKVPLMRNEECIEFPADQSTITRRYADEGIKFISESVKAEKPFFLYLANSMPHTPLFASSDFKGKSARGLYGDVIEEIDHNAGRIMKHLSELGIDGNTIVIFTSDNGPWLIKGDHGGCALPLFEGKMTSFEGGQRVPAIIKWPGHIPAGSTCSEMALSMDLLPTLAHITGAQLPEAELDGMNITDMLTAKDGAKTPHEYYFFVHNAVRSGDWKYHKKELFKVKATKRDTKGPTLYNLKDDIGESNNVIKDHPEIAERLAKALDAHIQRTPKPGTKK
ncbi:sulfatase family protein [Pontiella sulfatireligans]|uniref:Arylsulfatase n=1 Tax=Pontiella sulfatireligans TaxID=2750658 RepID=A0A6C2UKE6_9BACT|nr:sulfatase [Pontiella sulfatireligans]SPS74379.1 sulfatase S1_14 [Kiritimatiellales bacterium]VGO19666.1 Arylsulfatase [Pontiella sulfatireligans]